MKCTSKLAFAFLLVWTLGACGTDYDDQADTPKFGDLEFVQFDPPENISESNSNAFGFVEFTWRLPGQCRWDEDSGRCALFRDPRGRLIKLCQCIKVPDHRIARRK